HAVGVYEFEYARLLLDLLARVVATQQRRVEVLRPAHRLVRQTQVAEYSNVEVVLAEQEFVYVREERARLCALYDSVVVGRGDVDDLADAYERQGLRRHRVILRRVLNRARRDDGRLPGHQSRV